MQALGLIETRGLIAAIESADAMLKAAEVSLLEKTYVGGGLVTIAVTGDVGAVKAAVEAGAAAVRHLNNALLLSEHVIPRPHQELDDVIVSTAMLKKENIQEMPSVKSEMETKAETESKSEAEAEIAVDTKEEIEAESVVSTADAKAEIILEDLDDLHKDAVDKIVLANGVDNAIFCTKQVESSKASKSCS